MPSAQASSSVATPCCLSRRTASSKISWWRSAIWSCHARCGNSITSRSCILDDLGYIQQSPEEAEVLFTLLAERYERRSVILTSNLVFGEWDRIFRDQMATAAAIDRLIHHSVILEFDVLSFRAEEAEEPQEEESRAARQGDDVKTGGGRCQTRGRADAPTGLWKTADGFPHRPPPHHLGSTRGRREDQRHGERPANDNYPVRSGRDQHSFADPSPAEIVVANRQK